MGRSCIENLRRAAGFLGGKTCILNHSTLHLICLLGFSVPLGIVKCVLTDGVVAWRQGRTRFGIWKAVPLNSFRKKQASVFPPTQLPRNSAEIQIC